VTGFLGSVTVNGPAYVEHPAPLHEVGALLHAKAVHTGRSAADHLRVMAATTGIGRGRVEAGMVELTLEWLVLDESEPYHDLFVERSRENRADASCGGPRASRRGED
jgi:hypothetical protein